ncbi:MAG: serine hydrolase [bacterium]|nr:serine hydrolase [bacterium]
MLSQKHWGFSGSALVIYKDEVLIQKGYGWADQEFRQKNGSETKFFVGSVTKQFTALAVLLLEEDGRLKLDDPITKHIAELPQQDAANITVHHLLSHTSGLYNYTDDSEVMLLRTTPVALNEIIEEVKSRALRFKPGTRFEYSNTNYVLLGEIIERVSRQSYEAFLHHRILKPLGMLSSGYGRRDMAVPRRASGYTMEESGHLTNAPAARFSMLHSAGALYTTTNDLEKWYGLLARGDGLGSGPIQKMLTPYAGHYGYGFWLERKDGHRHAFHAGFIDGYYSRIDWWPDNGLFVAVLANDDEAPVPRIANGLASIVFGERPITPEVRKSIQLPVEALVPYAGLFTDSASNGLSVTLIDRTLQLQFSMQPPKQLVPEAADTFFVGTDNNQRVIYQRDLNDSIVGLDLFDTQAWGSFKKQVIRHSDLQSEPIAGRCDSVPSLSQYVGTYELRSRFADGTDKLVMEVSLSDNQLCASLPGTSHIILQHIENHRFGHQLSGFSITFEPKSDSKPQKCRVVLGNARINGVLISR